VQSNHALSTLPVTIKSEENEVLMGDREQLGLDPNPPTDDDIQQMMIDDPAMQLDVKMFDRPLTRIPNLPRLSTSSLPRLQPSLIDLEPEDTLAPFSSQPTTIDADVESDDNAVLQVVDYDISMTALPFLSRPPFQSPTPGPCMESDPTQPPIAPQKRKAADLDLEDSQDPGKKRLQVRTRSIPSLPPLPFMRCREFTNPTAQTSPPGPLRARASSSTTTMTSVQPEEPVLTRSQRFLEENTNLSSSLFSLKKGDKEWFTFVKLRNKHRWTYGSLTGAALQSATNILNGEIETPKSSHAVRQCLKDLETEVVRRISSKDYTSASSFMIHDSRFYLITPFSFT
jgi:hypothetical protein